MVLASARWALSLGPCPLDPWPARLQLPLGSICIFACALIYLSIIIKYLFLYLLHLFITSLVWLLSLSIFMFIFDLYYCLFYCSFFVLRSSFFVGCIFWGSLFVRTPYLRIQGRMQFFEKTSKRRCYCVGNRSIVCALTCSFG